MEGARGRADGSGTPTPPVPTRSAGRLFLGIPIGEEARNALRSHLQGEELPGRVVPPENWHLTLRFLGDTPPDRLERLREELRAAEVGSRTAVGFDGLGAFPRAARASVLWLGVEEGADALCALAERMEATARRAGFPAEKRPFRPHLTLSRIQPPRDVRPLIERVPPLSERMPVDAVVLFLSHLGRAPARYEELDRFHLSPPR
jgi:2'-5' RNA ligase